MSWPGTCLKPVVHYSRLALSAATVLLFLGNACSSSKKTAQTTPTSTSLLTPRNAKVFAVTADSAAFYRRGPQPGRQPDQMLPRETLVKLIRPSFGYSKVKLVASGDEGYVATEDIKPASPTLLASASSTPASSTPTASLDPTPSIPGPEQFNIDSTDPRLIPPPEELPNPDLPASPPEQ